MFGMKIARIWSCKQMQAMTSWQSARYLDFDQLYEWGSNHIQLTTNYNPLKKCQLELRFCSNQIDVKWLKHQTYPPTLYRPFLVPVDASPHIFGFYGLAAPVVRARTHGQCRMEDFHTRKRRKDQMAESAEGKSLVESWKGFESSWCLSRSPMIFMFNDFLNDFLARKCALKYLGARLFFQDGSQIHQNPYINLAVGRFQIWNSTFEGFWRRQLGAFVLETMIQFEIYLMSPFGFSQLSTNLIVLDLVCPPNQPSGLKKNRAGQKRLASIWRPFGSCSRAELVPGTSSSLWSSALRVISRTTQAHARATRAQ